MSRLEGCRPILTRSAEDSAAWADLLRAEGARPIVFPCLSTEASRAPALADQIRAVLPEADWLIFTSRRGVDAFADLVGRVEVPATRIAAVGRATAARLQSLFGRVDLVGSGTGETLAQELAPMIGPGSRCLLAVAANAGNTLERVLEQAGASVLRFHVYRTIPAPVRKDKLPLSTMDSATIIFASPSAVTGFANQVSIDTGYRIVSIGPSTSAAVREHGWTVTAEAREPGLSGIIESLMETADV